MYYNGYRIGIPRLNPYYFEGKCTLVYHDTKITLPYVRICGQKTGQWEGTAHIQALDPDLKNILGSTVKVTVDGLNGTANATADYINGEWTITLTGIPDWPTT